MTEWFERWFGEEYLQLYPHRDEDDAESAVALVERVASLDGTRVLDLACGRGRHARAAARLGRRVVAIDRHAEALSELARHARHAALAIDCVRSDVETGHGLPLEPGRFDTILVFRFLHRALADALVAALRPGGLLLYETFTIHQRELGYGPRNPAFLLEPDELPGLFGALELLHHQEGRFGADRPAALARLAARKPSAQS